MYGEYVKTKVKNIKIDEDFANKVEILCEVLQTTFTDKSKDLLVQWYIDKLSEIREKSPDLYEIYLSKMSENN